MTAGTDAIALSARQAAAAPLILTLTPRAAAAALSVSASTLRRNTEPTGDLACVRVGASVRYDVDDLKAWIARHKSLPPQGPERELVRGQHGQFASGAAADAR